MNKSTRDWRERLRELVGQHGCESCWSDTHGNCSCEREQRAMKSLEHFIAQERQRAVEEFTREVHKKMNTWEGEGIDINVIEEIKEKILKEYNGEEDNETP